MIDSVETPRSLSVYADTSVFGGVFDDEFREASRAFIDAVKAGKFALVTSELVRQELEAAPQNVRGLFE
jgi:predicted nucleic acid-binding protein